MSIPDPTAAGAAHQLSSRTCCVCQRVCGASTFVFADGNRCARHALRHPPTLRRSLRVALLVGTILFLINQADVVLSGRVTTGVLAKVALTYAVPFCVATYAALSGARRKTGGGG